MKIKLTKALIYAAADDAAARSKRRRGVTITDDEAYDAYVEEFYRLWDFIGGADAWIDLPRE